MPLEKVFKKKFMKKKKLKEDLLKISTEILKYSKPVWKKIDEFKSNKKKFYSKGHKEFCLILIMEHIHLLLLQIQWHQPQQQEVDVVQIQ